MTTPNRIKEILAERRDEGIALSQETLARRLGISVFTLNRIANGKQTNVAKHLKRKIAVELGLPLEKVFPPPAPTRRARTG